ncbi:hypothetical protein MHPYR_710017 [uncultured Mycobacterium sp.]|uniref:Uncharacterized protein n=1 Tax=uncultured Mycobacterium sp. TaxID=171292 RepID=A0A1Y5PPI7_9MYCO|nr:hypothetical protein MHPYR_710017 [uncultured Mycobacterium sp.]
MTNTPLGDTGYEIERILVQSVENGDTLVFDLGGGPQSFTVDSRGFESKRDPQGELVNTMTLTLVPSEGETKYIEVPLGTEVARVIKSDSNS